MLAAPGSAARDRLMLRRDPGISVVYRSRYRVVFWIQFIAQPCGLSEWDLAASRLRMNCIFRGAEPWGCGRSVGAAVWHFDSYVIPR